MHTFQASDYYFCTAEFIQMLICVIVSCPYV